MPEDTDATSGERIESKLLFDTGHYRDEEPYERIAEGFQRRDDRKIIYAYDVDHTRTYPLLRVHARYYEGDDMIEHSTRTYRVEDGAVRRTEQELTAFVETDFDDDPEAFDAAFESVVEGKPDTHD